MTARHAAPPRPGALVLDGATLVMLSAARWLMAFAIVLLVVIGGADPWT